MAGLMCAPLVAPSKRIMAHHRRHTDAKCPQTAVQAVHHSSPRAQKDQEVGADEFCATST